MSYIQNQTKKAVWTGLSGQKYTYSIYPIGTLFNANQDGNYLFAKVVNGFWKPIYIGQGDLGQRTNLAEHHQAHCIRLKGVTHVHVHLNSSKASRLAEERDLLSYNHNAYQPTGCNERQGG